MLSITFLNKLKNVNIFLYVYLVSEKIHIQIINRRLWNVIFLVILITSGKLKACLKAETLNLTLYKRHSVLPTYKEKNM